MEGLKYIGSRILQSFFALFCIITITFFLVRLAPGSPLSDEKAIPPHLLAQMNEKYGLDKSIPVQYVRYLGLLSRGDLGPSFANKGFTVKEVIAQSWPVSAIIGFLGLGIALVIGIPVGVFAASKRNTNTDYFLMGVAMLGICLPTVVIGPLLGLLYAAYIARLTRGSMLDVLSQDYIRTARAKGVGPLKILFKHAFRGGITPVVAYLGPALAGLIGGSFVVEQIFGLPGLGQHFIKAAVNRDLLLINGTVTVFAILIIAMTFIVDLVLAWLDPRRNLTTS